MTQDAIAWPRKTRELMNHHMDSTVWNDFKFRDDDIIVGTYAKSGTTWTQQIVGQLVFKGDPDVDIAALSPWVDLRVPPKEVKLGALDAQTHRRIMKTHLPLDALNFSPRAKYIYIGRDGRDVVWSFYHHHSSANELWYQMLNDTPGRVGPPIGPPDPDIRAYFRAWLERDGFPLWSYWDNIATWWAARDLPNVHVTHFSALKGDLPGEMKQIAAFLDIDVEPALWPTILDHCSFEYMKAHAALVAPLGGAVFEGGADRFINRGVNGRWRDALSPSDQRDYEERAVQELGAACARWLETGDAPSA
jgi:aryl sulfotransferase